LEREDQELVELVQKGDRAAFRILVQRYERKVYGIAYGMVRNEDDAMDVAQEAFLKVHRYIDRFQGASNFYTWLYRIVVNLCIDFIRKSRKVKQVDYDDSLSHEAGREISEGKIIGTTFRDPLSNLTSQELGDEIKKALDALSDKHKEVILLREIEGFSYQEIADLLEISVGTVMSRLHHARQNLQRSLRRYMKKT
jgi:RNA polymerase sigma-70 factor (ECF subfamily)